MDKAVNPHEGARDVATFWQAGVGGAGPRRVCTHSACWPCALTHFAYPSAACALHFLEPSRRDETKRERERQDKWRILEGEGGNPWIA